MSEDKKKQTTPRELWGSSLLDYITNLNDNVDWMADGFLIENSINMLYATDGIGKSLIGIQCAIELASGLPVFKSFHTEKPYKIIYCVAERSIKEPTKRIKTMIHDPELANKINFDNFTITTELQGRDLSNPEQARNLLAVLKNHASRMNGVDICFFDPLYALVKGDLKDDKAINGVFDFFRLIGSEMGSSVFFLHHENRGQKEQGATERTGQDFYGNKFISGLCTSVWHMKKDKTDGFKTIIKNEKDSESCLIPSFHLAYEPEFNTVSANVSSSPKTKEILTDAFFKKCKDSNRKFNQDEFVAETGIQMHHVTKRKFFSNLVKIGRLKNTAQNGQKGIYFVI